MPQTISIVRGTTTITNNSLGTLFTNGAGGLGTRVIINQLGFTGTNSAPGQRNTGGTLTNDGSGVGQTTIGIAGSGGTSTGFVSPFLSNSVSTAPTFGTSGVIVNTVIGAPSMTLSGKNDISFSVSQPVSSLMPQTFWIGPSDIIQARPFGFLTNDGKGGGTNSSVTVRYSFTLITET